MKKIILTLVTLFIWQAVIFSQDSPRSLGELYVETLNAPQHYSLDAEVRLIGMGFSGSYWTQKVYSDVYTNSGNVTQSITGGSYTINENNSHWYIEHIEGEPDPGKTWIGYGLYKITVEEINELNYNFQFLRAVSLAVQSIFNSGRTVIPATDEKKLLVALFMKFGNIGELDQKINEVLKSNNSIFERYVHQK